MYFVLDLGGTNFRISWANFIKDPKTISDNVIKIRNKGNYEKDSAQIINTMKSRSTKSNRIVVALPGNFSHKKMVLENANNLETWIDKPFFKQLEAEFDCSVLVDKDSSIAGMGEGVNSLMSKKTFLYVTWGTGIGGCIITTREESVPMITTLDWNTTFGKLEALCGGGNAVTNFGVELKYLDGFQWSKLVEYFVNEVEIIGNELGLNSVVLGGGIAAKRGDIVSEIRKGLKKRKIDLVKSKLGDFSAFYGGYILLSLQLGDTNKIPSRYIESGSKWT